MYFLYKKTPLSVSHFLAEVFVYTNITLKRSILKFRFIFSPIPPPTSPHSFRNNYLPPIGKTFFNYKPLPSFNPN